MLLRAIKSTAAAGWWMTVFRLEAERMLIGRIDKGMKTASEWIRTDCPGLRLATTWL